MEIAFAAELPARQQVLRATWDPLYMSSALGRMLILELRKDYREKMEEDDEAFDLASFHERFLELAVPASLARDIMLPVQQAAPPRRRR
jgi:hypothetical protein